MNIIVGLGMYIATFVGDPWATHGRLTVDSRVTHGRLTGDPPTTHG